MKVKKKERKERESKQEKSKVPTITILIGTNSLCIQQFYSLYYLAIMVY